MDQCNDTDHDEATLEPPATLAEAGDDAGYRLLIDALLEQEK